MAQLNQKLTSGSDVTLPVVDQLAMYFDENNKVAFKNVNGDIIPLIKGNAESSISSSFAQTSSVALNVDYANVNNRPTLVSASSQVSYPELINIPAGIVSSSEQISNLSNVYVAFATSASQAQTSSVALNVDYTNVSNLPTLVSASSQVLYSELSNIPAGIVSSSEQISNLVGVSASFATSASRAQTSSIALNVDYANISNRPALISASSQVSYTGLSNIPAGILSSSAQINNLSNVTASVALNVDYANVSNRPALVSASSQVSYTGLSNIPANIVSSSAQISNYNIFATTGSNTFQSNQIVSGSLTITQNLVVLGSSSINYVSQSTLNIGTNLITVNVQNPAVRFGGLAVNDSGSSPLRSGSILFDSVNDQWIFVHQNVAGGVTSSIVVMGPPTFNNIGNETLLTQNRLLKGAGLEHITDSQITDDGTNVGIGISTPGAKLHVQGNVSASSFSGSFSGSLPYAGLTGVPSGIVSSSGQVSYTGLSNIPANILSSSDQINSLSGVSASFATSASRAQTASIALNVDYANVSNRPALVSASSQISYTGLSNIPTDIVSSSTQINNLVGVSASFATSASRAQTSSVALNVDYVNVSNRPALVSASSQITYTGISSIPAGILSSSEQINNLVGVSASFALTASYALNGSGGSPESASFATSASYANTASFAISASWAPSSGTSTIDIFNPFFLAGM